MGSEMCIRDRHRKDRGQINVERFNVNIFKSKHFEKKIAIWFYDYASFDLLNKKLFSHGLISCFLFAYNLFI